VRRPTSKLLLPGHGSQEAGMVDTLSERSGKPSAQAGALRAMAEQMAPLVC